MIFVIREESAGVGAKRVKSFTDSCRTFITPKNQNQPEIELNDATDKSHRIESDGEFNSILGLTLRR